MYFKFRYEKINRKSLRAVLVVYVTLSGAVYIAGQQLRPKRIERRSGLNNAYAHFAQGKVLLQEHVVKTTQLSAFFEAITVSPDSSLSFHRDEA